MKKKSKKTNPIYFCPKCKSSNVIKEMNVLIITGAPQQWICNSCGFKSYLFPQKIKKKKL